MVHYCKGCRRISKLEEEKKMNYVGITSSSRQSVGRFLNQRVGKKNKNNKEITIKNRIIK